MIKRLIGRIKTLRLYFVTYSIFKRYKSYYLIDGGGKPEIERKE